MLSQINAIEPSPSLDVTPANSQDRLIHTVITPLLDQHLNKVLSPNKTSTDLK